MNRFFRSALASFAITLACTAQAAPAATLQPGESVLFNFDLSGASTPPPYSAIVLRVTYDGTNVAGQRGIVTLFDELNGDGTGWLIEDASVTSAPVIYPTAIAGLLDGLFSLRVTSGGTVGFGVNLPSVLAITGPDSLELFATLAPNAVPEPATLALFGLALGGLGLSRWRTARSQRRVQAG